MFKKLLELFWPRKAASVSKRANVSVERGCWGEDVAVSHLRSIGWSIVERNARPCRKDRRCEIDIVAYVPIERQVVFVEVKTHKQHSSYANRLWAVNKRKKANLLRACANWLMQRKWHGNYRFDVIEVYGEPDGLIPPEVDHIFNVKLFSPKWRFW